MVAKNKFRVVFNRAAFQQLRQEAAVRAELMRRAERLAAAASEGGRVDGYVVTDLVLEEPRGAVSVMATGHAHAHNRKNHALLRAIDAARGD